MSFPIDKFASVEFEQIDDVRLSGQRLFNNRARGSKASFFKLMLTTPPLVYQEGMKLGAYLTSLQSGFVVFTVANPFPVIGAQSGLELGSLQVRGDSTINITGISGTLSAGNFIRIAGGSKVYMVAEDTTGPTVKLTSPLVANHPDNSAVFFGATVDFQVSLVGANSLTKIDAKNSKFITHDIEVIEQI